MNVPGVFRPLEAVRERFVSGWIRFQKQGDSYAYSVESGDEGDEEIPVGTIPIDLFRRYMQQEYGIEMEISHLLQMYPSYRSEEKKKVIEDLIIQCALAFAPKHFSALGMGRAYAEFYEHYARLMQRDGSPDTLEWAFVWYVFDCIEEQ